MQFNTDSHFVIGHYHIRQNKPCQDHALNGTKDNNAAGMVCVSDGCSSGGHTDIGSRVITLSTIRAIKDRNLRILIDADILPSFMVASIGTYSMVSRTSLGITADDMLATSVYAVVNNKGGYIHMLGDGTCAIKYKTGQIAVISLDWQENTPYYPIYREENIEQFIAIHKRFNDGDKALRVSCYGIDTDGSVHIARQEAFVKIDDAINGYVINLEEGALQDIESITVFSDGVQDFQSADGKPVPTSKVIYDMTSFKNYTGEFVKRRVSAGLKAYAKEGIHPNDDFSMAAIHFNDSIEEVL